MVRTARIGCMVVFGAMMALLLGCAYPNKPVSSGDSFKVPKSSSEFRKDPILRLKSDRHFAPVRRISADSQGRFLVSGADDKTVKVWDLETGRLLQTLRIPVDKGSVGKIFSVALSPDGNTIAVGGNTGQQDSGGHNIYLLNRATGVLEFRIGALPNFIKNLGFSLDGRFLVAALGKGSGVRVFRTSDYHQIAKDTDYNGRIDWAEFGPGNSLVTASNNGYIRLYNSLFEAPKKILAPGGKNPFSVRFSPDGKYIAVGYFDSTRVDVLSARDLSFAYSADTTGIETGGLSSIAWSQDGRYLYGAGTYDVQDWNPIRRWDQSGRGAFEEFRIAKNTVSGLIGMVDGRLAVSAHDPLVAVLSADGREIWSQLGTIADFRGQRGGNSIRLSHNGDTVQFAFDPWNKRKARFSLSARKLTLDPSDDPKLMPAVIQAPELEVTDWEDSYNPKLNREVLALRPDEYSRSLAIAPDGEHFLLGAEWTLRYFDQQGNEAMEGRYTGDRLDGQHQS